MRRGCVGCDGDGRVEDGVRGPEGVYMRRRGQPILPSIHPAYLASPWSFPACFAPAQSSPPLFGYTNCPAFTGADGKFPNISAQSRKKEALPSNQLTLGAGAPRGPSGSAPEIAPSDRKSLLPRGAFHRDGGGSGGGMWTLQRGDGLLLFSGASTLRLVGLPSMK